MPENRIQKTERPSDKFSPHNICSGALVPVGMGLLQHWLQPSTLAQHIVIALCHSLHPVLNLSLSRKLLARTFWFSLLLCFALTILLSAGAVLRNAPCELPLFSFLTVLKEIKLSERAVNEHFLKPNIYSIYRIYLLKLKGIGKPT